MASSNITVAYIVTGISIAGGLLGILKYRNDSIEASMKAKVELGALRQDVLQGQLDCAVKIEALNEDWHRRIGK